MMKCMWTGEIKMSPNRKHGLEAGSGKTKKMWPRTRQEVTAPTICGQSSPVTAATMWPVLNLTTIIGVHVPPWCTRNLCFGTKVALERATQPEKNQRGQTISDFVIPWKSSRWWISPSSSSLSHQRLLLLFNFNNEKVTQTLRKLERSKKKRPSLGSSWAMSLGFQRRL